MKTYEEYKDSGVEWIGEIPKHWKIPRLRHLVTDDWGGEVIDKSYWGEGPEILYTTAREPVLCDFPEFPDTRRSTERDLLLSRNGYGIVHVPETDSIFTNVVQLIRLKKGIDRRFLRETLFSQIGPIHDQSDGDFITSLNKVRWFQVTCPLPSPSEQQQIVTYLDQKTSQIDELIDKKTRKIELLKEYGTSLINQVVTKGLDPNVQMKDSGVEWIGEIPVGWGTTKFKYVIDISEGQVDPKLDEYRQRILIAPNHIESSTGRLIQTETAEEQGAESGKYLFNEGDILYSKIRPALRKVCIAPCSGLCSADMYPLTVKGNLLPPFLLLFLLGEYFSRLALERSQRVAMPKINREDLLNFSIFLPPLPEQQQIVTYLDQKTQEIDQSIETEEKKIEHLKEYRQSLISNVVTGKVDVRDTVLS